jgi:GTPase SAR1 family protein
LKRVVSKKFNPNEEDVKNCLQRPTVGITNVKFSHKNVNYSIIDCEQETKLLTERKIKFSLISKDLGSIDIVIFLFSLEDTKMWEESFIHFQKLKKEFKTGKIIAIHNKKDLKSENMEIDSKKFKKSELIEVCLKGNSQDSEKIIEMILKITKKMKFAHVKEKIEPKNDQKPLNIVLLGPGEVGKSTIFKRLKLKNNSLVSTEYSLYQAVASSNILHGMKNLFPQLLKEKWNPKDQVFVQDIMDLDDANIQIFSNTLLSNFKDQIKDLFQNDETFQNALMNHHKYRLYEGFPYYIEHLDQVIDNEIENRGKIADEMILRGTSKTTGIVHFVTNHNGTPITIFDTGGQRNERKKWIHATEIADAFIFVGALSQFNELCYEDDKTNKLHECLELAEVVSKSNSTIPMYLFLNKQDAFIEELKKDLISIAFPDCPKNLQKLQTPSIFFSPLKKEISPFSKSISFSTKKQSMNLSFLKGDTVNSVEFGEDVICQIFSFLNYKEILKFSLVNSSFWEASQNDLLWRDICLSYDKTLDFETVESFYDESSLYSPWKHYFIESKTIYIRNQNFILEKFQKATNNRFQGVYVTNTLDDSILNVLNEVLDEICSMYE